MRRGLLVVAAALALGAGAAGAATPTNPLAVLAVPKADLGKLAAGLQVELKSGTTDNARAASDSFDPADTDTTVTRAGRLAGYALLYGDVGWTGLRTGHGLLDVGTQLDAFKTIPQATAYAAKSLRDAKASVGKNLQGTVIERVQVFKVTGLGPNAAGLLVTQRLGKHRIHSTFIDFQIATILCEASINRADTVDVRPQVAQIAQQLRDRIAAYGNKQLNAKPVTLPRPLNSAKPGPNAPNLSAMVPTAADLKGKAGVLNQGYQADDDALVSYAREFSFGSSSQTGLYTLHSQAELQRSKREASGHFFVIRSVFSGPEAGETLARLIAPGATVIHLDGTQSAKVGDESFATAVSFISQGQRLRALMIYERRERILGSIILVGKAERLNLAGAAAYARTLDKRIKSGLHPALVA